MNTKRKSVIGITLATIMIVSIFAVIAPATTADPEAPVGNPAGFSVNKETIPDPAATYNLSEPIKYQIRMENDKSAFDAHVNVWDVLPNGTKIEWKGNATQDFPVGSGEQTWEFETTVQADWIDWSDPEHPIFTNTVYVEGYVDNPSAPDEIHQDVDHTSALNVEPPEFEFGWVPACCKNISFSGWADKSVVNYTWDFGDVSPDETHEEDLPGETYHVYGTCGDYWVTLSGWSLNGIYLYNETKHQIHVDCGPTAKVDYNPTCFEKGGTEITFKDVSTIDSMPIIKREWNIDGFTSGDEEVTVTVTEEVTATLTVWTGLPDGTLCCEDSTSVTIGPCSGCSLRIYGTFNEGAGDDTVRDPETGLFPENKPYTNPIGPFQPQNPQAPRKDFITFNPAIMDHNQGYDLLIGYDCVEQKIVQRPQEKVFKRMWYEKEWFKDHDSDGVWDVVVDTPQGVITMPLAAWNAIPAWEKERDGWSIREWNNDPTINDSNVDIYGPAINQEFTYMFLDDERMPILTRAGSVMYIPMAHDDANPYRGLNSFDADGDGDRDAVRVESEQTVGIDIDGDGVFEPMGNLTELDGDESVVFVLENKFLEQGDTLQFFDHVVTLKDVQEAGIVGNAVFDVCDNEGGGSQRCTENVVLSQGAPVATFHRGRPGTVAEAATFYVRLVSADAEDNTAIVEVGRMFGQPYANIGGTNPFWSQKAFIVDEVFYNVVAIKALDNCFKYITFRQKLPKLPIKLYGKHLEVWAPQEMLPEMSPFNMDHEVCVDIWDTWTRPHSQQDKIGPKEPRPPLRIDYIYEGIEERYAGELKEIYAEIGLQNEFWELEWFWTLPWQFTELRLPKDDKYLVTLSWIAPEAEITIWDGVPDGPIDVHTGDRFKFWYEDCSGPIYIDDKTSSIRLYGIFGEGAGDDTAAAIDPVSGLMPENKPYTDPVAPFQPQHWQAPRKDFMTFNPAIMDHNQGYPELDYYECGLQPSDVQIPKEKVFKRMWYEKEWFKDHDSDGVWDVVVDNTTSGEVITMPLQQWNAIPLWIKLRDSLVIREHNNDPTINDSNVDIYGPAVNQEFTYMVTDDETMPILVGAGSKVLIPMASYEPENGLDSFDADGDGVRDAVSVESEQTVGIDIDGDFVLEPMGNLTELDGDESVVFMLENKYMYKGGTIQFFDHVVKLKDVQEAGINANAIFDVCDNEGGDSQRCTSNVQLPLGGFATFHRGRPGTVAEAPTFYLRVLSADAEDNTAIVEVGRMFGQPYANIGGTNPFWSQKAFIVDEVFYNVVAIKAVDNCFKYITFRQKLPKMPIKMYTKHLEVWATNETLPEMPPFNMDHEILIDVQNTWTRPYSQQDKIGKKEPRGPLEIYYIEEDVEKRFAGELREIYAEIGLNEFWIEEWFFTQPWQYTAFVLPDDQLYLLTLAWFAPEAEITIWDAQPDGPINVYNGERVKFWYDPADNTDLYVNRLGDVPAAPGMEEYYDMATHGGDGDGSIGLEELVNAIMDYINKDYPFGPGGMFDKLDLLDYLQAYVDQESGL